MNSNKYFNSNYNDYIFNQIPTNIIQTHYKINTATNIPNKHHKNLSSNKLKINNTSFKQNKINSTIDNSNYDYLSLNNKNILNRYGSQGKIPMKNTSKNQIKNQIKNQNINKINQNKFKTIGETINNKNYINELKKKDHSTIDYSNLLGNNIFKKYNLNNNKRNLSRPKTPDYDSIYTNNNNKKKSNHIRQKTPDRLVNRMKLNLNKDFIGNNYEKKSPIKSNRNKNYNLSNTNNTTNTNNYSNNNTNNNNNTLFQNYYHHTKTF